ncbi:MAG: hypothetical protein R3C59_27420 [Planctomycetaceae bacterium]
MSDRSEKDTAMQGSASPPCSTSFLGYVVTYHKYSGEVQFDDLVWIDREAAEFRLQCIRDEMCGEWEEAKKRKQVFDPIDETRAMGKDDRQVYTIVRDSRDDLIRAAAIEKLNDDERRVLGLT